MRSSKSRSRNKSNRQRTLGNIVNRVFDSSGPEGKVRGTPQQIIDKYLALARDAQLSNDRVAEQSFLQHAEHYTRMLGEAQREMAERQGQQPGQPFPGRQGFDDDRDYGGNGYGQGLAPDQGQRRDGGMRDPNRDNAGREGQNRDNNQNRDGQGREGQGRDGRDGQSRDGQREGRDRGEGRERREDRWSRGRDEGRRDEAAREEGRRDETPREPVARDDSGRDQAGRDQAGRDQAGRDQVGRDQVGREAGAAPVREVEVVQALPDALPVRDAGEASAGPVETPESAPEAVAQAAAPRRGRPPRVRAEGEEDAPKPKTRRRRVAEPGEAAPAAETDQAS